MTHNQSPLATELWTPESEGDAPAVLTVVGTEVKHRCHFCDAVFYDTGDAQADDNRFLLHFEKCWKVRGEDETGTEIEMRRDEPLSQSDKEQVDWLRRDAARRRDTSVKGVTGYE